MRRVQAAFGVACHSPTRWRSWFFLPHDSWPPWKAVVRRALLRRAVGNRCILSLQSEHLNGWHTGQNQGGLVRHGAVGPEYPQGGGPLRTDQDRSSSSDFLNGRDPDGSNVQQLAFHNRCEQPPLPLSRPAYVGHEPW